MNRGEKTTLTLKWKDLLKAAKKAGVTDETEIWYIDISSGGFEIVASIDEIMGVSINN
jgi:hypothetical protein